MESKKAEDGRKGIAGKLKKVEDRKRVDKLKNAEKRKKYKKEDYMDGIRERVCEGVRGIREAFIEKISAEEMVKVVKKLKDRKAVGKDGIENEVWKYRGRGVKTELRKFCNEVWRGEYWPEGWSMEEVVPILKKEDGKRVEDFRGVTLMDTAYKVYAEVLEGRLKKEIDERRIIPENQTRFSQQGDIKAAFDSVNRIKLWESMEERGKAELEERKMGGRDFLSREGSDIEDRLKSMHKGDVAIGSERIYILQYADDIVLLAEEKGSLRLMMEESRRYLEEKKLELSVEKTEIMKFGRRKNEKRIWKWGNKEIDEVERFKYLGFICERKGGFEAHEKERVKKAKIAMKEIWGIGKRYFKRSFERRIWFFDMVVWASLRHGAEIWGWKERGEVERC
ncbi:uncharacterized protein LOC143184778 [Calliopsis andreniformis]|uniref:uncharacterized protein LOC143184778 n=1 Tax=Calliopsis andreniformis TaxID=337506 RepID=UPI003FCC8EFB